MSRREPTPAAASEAPVNEPMLMQAPLTDRVNVEPPILNGMTATEAKYLGLAALAVWLVIGGALAALTGFWQLILAAVVFGPMCTLWLGSLRLASVKRNRPDGHLAQSLRIALARHGLGRMPFIQHDGAWTLGRPLSWPKR